MLSILSLGQNVGSYTSEAHLAVPIQKCSKAGCTTESTAAVLDSNWRWTHEIKEDVTPAMVEAGEIVDCYEGNLWDKTLEVIT